MDKLSRPIQELFQEKNTYDNHIGLYCELLSYIPYFEDICEKDYIKYHDDHSFEYTPEFYSFIKALFDSKMVEQVDTMTDFLNKYNSSSAYKVWIKEMNLILSNDTLISNANLSFIRKAFFSMIKLEKVMPGSWGIDVETGNWFKLLKRLQKILPEVYRCDKETMN